MILTDLSGDGSSHVGTLDEARAILVLNQGEYGEERVWPVYMDVLLFDDRQERLLGVFRWLPSCNEWFYTPLLPVLPLPI
jgi:hypothetical protein